jgi:biopolymer transport protein ExbD
MYSLFNEGSVMWTETHTPLHRRNRLFINLTSLVDVLFILLIFFTLTATFERSGVFDVNLPKAKTGGERTDRKAHEITVFNQKELALDGIRMDSDELLARVKQWPEEEKTQPVLLKADEAVPYGKIVSLLDGLRSEGVVKVQALTRNE